MAFENIAPTLARLFHSLQTWLMPFKLPFNEEVYMLGRTYPPPEVDAEGNAPRPEDSPLYHSFTNVILFTYRCGFDSIEGCNGPSSISDKGWGCAIRATQMLLAQAVREASAIEDVTAETGSVLSLFLDTADAPLSLHRMVKMGQEVLAKRPGTWFGPTSGGKVASKLVKAAYDEDIAANRPPRVPFHCVAFDDGVLYKDQVEALLTADSSGLPVLVLLCVRLGQDATIPQSHVPLILECFRRPGFVGLSSGESTTSAFYFVAAWSGGLYYLDPHIATQPALTNPDKVEENTCIHQLKPHSLGWSRLNSSMCFGFLLRNKDELNDLADWIKSGNGLTETAQDGASSSPQWLFEVLDTTPAYAKPGGVGTDDDLSDPFDDPDEKDDSLM
ncbi:Cysteine protease atg4c [Perkinsus chesapeaki]|uniref:Cysteine protease n=1 Tax=Perkinsus chesapeaki TaxID=330153 RepID=A0A7J6MDV1_PERCH|nr:Cysteine protease atg4c [Perkinsus chesapeaki]